MNAGGGRLTAVLVSVGYGPQLAVTGPRYRQVGIRRVVVVTTPEDVETQTVAAENGFEVVQTRVFYERGAKFNKGAGVELGLTVAGKAGPLVILDADIVLPLGIELEREVRPGWLMNARRRCWLDWVPGSVIPPELEWTKRWPEFVTRFGTPDVVGTGYLQVFAGADPVLAGREWWYNPNWNSAANSDSEFLAFWPKERRALMPWSVIHLGEPYKNWCGVGRADECRAMLAAQNEAKRVGSDMWKAQRLPPAGSGVCVAGLPHKLHFIWIGGELPGWAAANVAEWRRLNPDYEIKVHGEEILWPELRAAYDKTPRPAGKADILRYCVLAREGGWYADVDTWPFRPLAEAVAKWGLSGDRVAVSREHWSKHDVFAYNCTPLACGAGTPAVRWMLDQIRKRECPDTKAVFGGNCTWGPALVEELVAAHPEWVTVMDWPWWCPVYHERAVADYRRILGGDADWARRMCPETGGDQPMAMHLWAHGKDLSP